MASIGLPLLSLLDNLYFDLDRWFLNGRHMRKRILIGLLVTVLLTSAIKYAESTRPGKDAEKWLFANLQRLLPSFSEDLPVLVVDTSRIPGGKDQVTSREALKQTLTAIVAQRPAGVGVDIDFSPDVDGWQLDDDPKFFDFCLALTKESGVPIYLGVYRTIGENSDTWLGSAKYKGLAAALRAENDTMRLPKWIQTRNSEEKLPLMSAALADSYQRSHPTVATPLLAQSKSSLRKMKELKCGVKTQYSSAPRSSTLAGWRRFGAKNLTCLHLEQFLSRARYLPGRWF